MVGRLTGSTTLANLPLANRPLAERLHEMHSGPLYLESSAADHSWSVWVSPHTCLGVRFRSRSTVRNGWPRIDAVEQLLAQLDG